MTIIVRDGTNAPRAINEIVVRDGTNTPRTLNSIWVRDSTNTPRRVFFPGGGGMFTVSISPTDVFGIDTGTGTATTDGCTATPSGGTAPYTYLWTLISFTAGVPPTTAYPTLSSTYFEQTGLSPTEFQSAVFRCSVTDGIGDTAFADVNANFYAS